VTDVQKGAGDRLIVHTVRVLSSGGVVSLGNSVEAVVDSLSRSQTASNHTATHLLQSALKMTMGENTAQAGSLVTPDRLRFDFNSPEGLKDEEIEQVERIINTWIQEGRDVTTVEMDLEDAKEAGATAMFGEKYSQRVRVVDVIGERSSNKGEDDEEEDTVRLSMELCGGTHVSNTSQIGGFKVLSESGIASGVRRIEAVTGPGMVQLLNSRDNIVKSLTSKLKVKPEEVVERIEKLQDEVRASQQEAAKLKAELALVKCQALSSSAETLPRGQIVVQSVEGIDAKSLQAAAEQLLSSLGDPSAVVLASHGGGKVALVAAFSPQVVKEGLSAGKVIGAAAKICGGGGGGRPNFAQAGGKDAAKIPEALECAREQLVKGLSD